MATHSYFVEVFDSAEVMFYEKLAELNALRSEFERGSVVRGGGDTLNETLLTEVAQDVREVGRICVGDG